MWTNQILISVLFVGTISAQFVERHFSDDVADIPIQSIRGQSPSEEVDRLAGLYGDNFVQNSECGGVMEGQGGAVSYKLNENITQGEICVWTIVVPHKKTIQVKLLEDGFTKGCTNCQILYVFNMTNKLFAPALEYAKTGDRGTYNITGGSAIQVVFTDIPGWHNEAQGFLLTFQGLGPDMNETDVAYSTYKVFDQFNAPSGVIRYPESGTVYPTREYMLMVLNPEDGKQIAVTLESHNNTRINPIYANCESVNNNFVLTEFKHFGKLPTRRFSECRPSKGVTTIYSPAPLFVAYYSFTGDTGGLQFSWKMVD